MQTAQPTPGPAELISFEGQIDPLKFIGDLVERYGDVVRYRTRYAECFLFVRPEHVQNILHRENYRRASLVKMMLGEGLLASDGTLWRSQRRVMQPDFHPAAMGHFIPVMTGEAAKTAGAWASAARGGEPINITEAMTQLTLRIVVKTLFSNDLSEGQVVDLCEAITETIIDMGKISWTVFGVPVRFAPDRNAKFSRDKALIDKTCYDIIARRRAEAPERRPRDLLSILIAAEAGSGRTDDRQLRDEMVTMLIGGHETTALALAWTWKLLTEHPEVEARLHAELDEVLGGRPPELTDLPRLRWTRAVFQEAMRLYPPVWYMARTANEDDVIHGHAVPKNACVLVSAWLTHRHAEFWADPERFDPTRFLEPVAQPPHRYAYFPFGGGRHQCLGIHFALMEGTTILAQLAQGFRLRPHGDQDVRPDPGITLRQSPLLECLVEARASAAALPVRSEGA